MGQLFSRFPPQDTGPSAELAAVEFDNETLRAALAKHKARICAGELTIADWDVRKVTDMGYLFYNWALFDQPLRWDVSKVTTMHHMFSGCAAFNQPLRWNTKSCRVFHYMFKGCIRLNQRVELDVSAVESADGLYGLFDATAAMPRLVLVNKRATLDVAELDERVQDAIHRGGWRELCRVCKESLLPVLGGGGQLAPTSMAPNPAYLDRVKPTGLLSECCARCERSESETTAKATAAGEKAKANNIELRLVKESDHTTRRFARAVFVLLLRELHYAGETFGCTSPRRMRLYLETIKANIDAATHKDKQGKDKRQATAGADAEVTAVTTADLDSAFESLENGESSFLEYVRNIVDFKGFKEALTPRTFYDNAMLFFKAIARVEDAVLTKLKVVEMQTSIRSQAGCGLAALARASCRDAKRAAELELKIAENKNEPPETDPLYSAAAKAAKAAEAAEAADAATPPAEPRPARPLVPPVPLDATRPPGSLSHGFFDLEAASGSTTLDFARGLFVCNLMELSSRIDHFSVTRASFGVANFAMQRIALGGFAAKLAPGREERVLAHIEMHERNAGRLIREALVDDDALATPRRWVEATMRLLREFRESEAGMLRIVNAGLLPEHAQHAERTHDVDGLWGKAGCGLKGLELSQAAGYLSSVRSTGGPNIDDSFFSDAQPKMAKNYGKYSFGKTYV